MKTTDMILDIILDQTGTEYQLKADSVSAERYHDAITRAVGIVKARTLVSNADGTWTVRDTTTGSGKEYRVNGQCPCKAALRDKTQTGNAKGICKHRIAVKLARAVNAWFNDHRAQQHEHLCLGCNTPHTCWEEPCSETKHLTGCSACPTTTEEPPMETTCRNCHRARGEEVTHGCLPGYLHDFTTTTAEEPPMLTHDELQTLAAPPYEVNPQTLCDVCNLAVDGENNHTTCEAFRQSLGKDPVPQTTPAPEAPASLNIKVKVGQYEVMYTARSMQPGKAGDAELRTRLPQILETLAELQYDVTPKKDGQ